MTSTDTTHSHTVTTDSYIATLHYVTDSGEGRRIDGHLEGCYSQYRAIRIMGEEGDYAEALKTLEVHEWAIQRLMRETVAAAREAGKSWEYIGKGLGVTKQAAQQKYGSN